MVISASHRPRREALGRSAGEGPRHEVSEPSTGNFKESGGLHQGSGCQVQGGPRQRREIDQGLASRVVRARPIPSCQLGTALLGSGAQTAEEAWKKFSREQLGRSVTSVLGFGPS